MNGDFNYRMPVVFKSSVLREGVSKAISSHIRRETRLYLSDPFLFANGVAQTIGDNLEGRQVSVFQRD